MIVMKTYASVFLCLAIGKCDFVPLRAHDGLVLALVLALGTYKSLRRDILKHYIFIPRVAEGGLVRHASRIRTLYWCSNMCLLESVPQIDGKYYGSFKKLFYYRISDIL